MTKEEAQIVLEKIMYNGDPTETWRERARRLSESDYPGLLPLYEEWLNGSNTPIKVFHNKLTDHIMTANTKLYKALR